MEIIKEISEAYNNIHPWKIIINNSDDLENLILLNNNENLEYNLVKKDDNWIINDENNNIINSSKHLIDIIKNNNKSIKLIGIYIKNISRTSRKCIYVVIEKLVSLDDWKKTNNKWWLPIYLNLEHFKKGQIYLENTISSLCNKFEFNEIQVFDIIPKLLINCSNVEIQLELNKIMKYYLDNNGEVYNNLKNEIDEFEFNPQLRKNKNLLCILIKTNLLYSRPKKYFMIKFWTEYWARRIKWLYIHDSKCFKMFYKYWNININYLSDKFIHDLNNFDSTIRNILGLKLVYWKSIYDWFINYLDLINCINNIEECTKKIQKSIRYICIIAFKQGYIPFNANHFNKNISLRLV